MNQLKIIIVAVAAAVLGLGAGYLLFRGEPDVPEVPAHEHAAEDGSTIWTCSMHPQIRQDHQGQCPICGMDLIPVGEGRSANPLVLEMTREAMKLANVQTTVVGRSGRQERTLRLTGKIQADERLTASQVAHVPGRIEELFVTFTGEQVKKGQPLIRLYSPELVTAQRELLEALRLGEIGLQLAEAARQKMRYWRIPEETIRAVEESGRIQESVTLYAETAGVVKNRRVAVGDYVREGAVLFEIIDLGRLWVLFDAYEEDLPKIRVGDRVTSTTPATGDQSFTTRISFIDPLIDPLTRVASLRGEVVNTRSLLKPEMFVRGAIQSEVPSQEALAVPKSAVLWTGKRSVVYVKVPDARAPSFEYREIVLGEALGRQYLVESGLQPGEEVVTNGAFSIDAAAQLNNQQSMMNRLVSLKGGEAAAAPAFRAETPEAFRQQLQALTRRYLSLKDAFVDSDAAAAGRAAEGFLEALNKMDMTLLGGPAHAYWMRMKNALEAHALQIGAAAGVEAQRVQFEFLSEAMIETVRAFGVAGSAVYVQHCPMAFDDKGADWLSAETEIRNPYFGTQMLTCGIVKDSL